MKFSQMDIERGFEIGMAFQKQPMSRKLLSAETTCPSRLFTEPKKRMASQTVQHQYFSAEELYLLGAQQTAGTKKAK